LIAAGRVTVNGAVARAGQQVAEGVVITVDGVPIPASDPLVYLAFNKPPGLVTTSRVFPGERNIFERLPAKPRVQPAGRLDKETSGLLLLTNDGEWADRVTHPRYQVEKEYEVLVDGHPSKTALERMRTGMELAPGVLTSPANVSVRTADAAGTLLSVTVMEGKKRQIRLMAEAVGHHVLALRRVRIGVIRLGSLPEGEWRRLRAEEVESIRDHAGAIACQRPQSRPKDRHRRAGGRR
jgi:pseudouridine synthase